MRVVEVGVALAILVSVSAVAGRTTRAETSTRSQASTQSTEGIDHKPVGCVVAEKFPRFDAHFLDPDNLAVARVLFQGADKQAWYSIDMKSGERKESFTGVLPRPRRSLKEFRYYIEATEKTARTYRTQEYAVAVADNVASCKGGVAAAVLASASVILQSPAGALAIPAGFASTGVVTGATAASAAGVAGAGATGGGLSTGTTLGVVAGAGAVAAAVALRSTACELTVITSPDRAGTGGAPFCSATVFLDGQSSGGPISGSQTRQVSCAAVVFVRAATTGTQAVWSGACSGTALGVECRINPLGVSKTVSLTCS